jgi:hypothetical protein
MIASTHHQFYGWIRCVSTPEMEAFFTMTFLPVVRIVLHLIFGMAGRTRLR